MSPRPARLAALALSGMLALPLVGACSADTARVSSAPVVAPGKPGEPATVHPPGTEFDPVDEGFTEADVAFVVGMVPHHEQAIAMADLAADRAEDSRVLGLAARIADVQDAEIAVLERWLAERDLAPDGRSAQRRSHSGHGDSGDGGHAAEGHQMPGMATPEEMARLEASTGSDFDRLWLELMIRHHEGALTMAEDRQRDGGVDIRAGELAADVAVTQLAEIRRMEAVLAEM